MNPDNDAIPLKDIHLPEAVSWFPPAPGWWIVLCLIVISVIAYVVYRRYRRRLRLREEALLILDSIKLDFQQHTNPVRFINEVSGLYRRLVMSLYPRQEVASLRGQAWLDFLNKIGADAGAHDVYFNAALGELLLTQQYQKFINCDTARYEQLYQLSKKWIAILPLKAMRPMADDPRLIKESI